MYRMGQKYVLKISKITISDEAHKLKIVVYIFV